MRGSDIEERLARLQHGRSAYALRGRKVTQFEDLENRRRETAVWCAQNVNLADVKNCLRPQSIAPHPLSTNRWAAVDEICYRRKYDLARASANVDARGRLLVYFPDEELWDGAAEVASSGFFDEHNAPPWGTWVGYFEDEGPSRCYLLALVPHALVGVADAGIGVNPEQSIAWLTDVQVGIRSVIHDRCVETH